MKKELYIYQQNYLEIIEDFFTKITKKNISKLSSFDDVIRSISKHEDKNISCYFNELEIGLKKMYSYNSSLYFSKASEYKSNKTVLGGSTKFFETQLNATLSSMLFVDTVLIPDPLMSYLEVQREDVNYVESEILHTAYSLLKLKKMNDSKFTELPFFIFPSCEKTLEVKDKPTQLERDNLITDFFKFYVNNDIQEVNDIFNFCSRNKVLFIKKVEENKLLYVPNGSPTLKYDESIMIYKEYCKKMRTPDFNKLISDFSDDQIAIMSIFERINAQYHLLENSEEMKANPLVCVPSQIHYYKLVSNMKNRCVAKSYDDRLILDTFQLPEMNFLSNVSLEQLIFLRQTDQNISFREELRNILSSFNSMNFKEIGYASKELCNRIKAAILSHEQEMSNLKRKFKVKHTETLLLGCASLIASFVPMLGPYISIAGLSIPVKYVHDKIDERTEVNKHSKSLMGVLAQARHVPRSRP